MATDRDLIIKLRAETKQFRKDLRNAKNQMKGFGKNINKIGIGIQSTLLAAFGGAAILQGIKTAIGSIANFEFAMDKVEAISGATGDTLKALKDNALDLGRTTKFTATEIAGLQLELSKLGFGTDKILASTDAIRKLATVTDQDLGESAKTLAGTLNSFNLEATESERVANLMAESFSSSALTLEKFTVATANSGAIANSLGVTLESNTARLGALVDANIDASKAGTDLRRIYIDLNKAGISYDDALDMIAKSSDQVGAATRLVGDRAAGALVILSNMRGKVDELTKSFSDNEKELDKQVAIMEDNLITDYQKLESAMDGLIQKGGALNGIFRGTTQALTDVINHLSGATEAQKFFAKAGVDGGGILGMSDSDREKVVKFYLDLSHNVRDASIDIKEGTRTFDGINIATLESAEALAVVNTRLNAYKDNKFFDDIKASIIPLVEELTAKINEQAKAFEAAANKAAKLAEIAGVGAGLEGIERAAVPGIESGVDAGRLFVISDESVDEAVEKNKQQTQKIQDGLITDIERLSDAINMTLEMSVNRAIVGIAEALGTGNLKGAFDSVLGVLADGMKQVGVAMIAYGVAGQAFQLALESLQPAVAIAAGVALVAAASAIKSSQSNFASSNSGGGSRGGGGGFAFDRSGQSVEVNINGRLTANGRDLELVLNNQNMANDRQVG